MTDAEFTTWLERQNAQRVILVELSVNSGGSEITRYLASEGWTSAPTDTPASEFYEGRIAGGLVLQETLGLAGGAATLSQGDIQLHNTDGALDSWLGDAWNGRAVTAYIGDPSWPKSDFRVVYAGVIEAVEGAGSDRISVRVQDKMKRLETAATETKLGGTTPNADALIPLCFGECHNISPLLTNPATLEYAVHNGPIEMVIEVRDEGVPVSFTPSLATGRFTLPNKPVGTITASVQGDRPSTYVNDVGALIQRLVKNFGRSDVRFTDADLDLTNLSAFVTANPAPVGLYLRDSTTVRQACTTLADSLGAKLVMTRLGKLRLVKLALPPASVADVTEDGMERDSLQVENSPRVQAACKLGYCRNWAVQPDLRSGVLADHKELFGQEWLTVTASDSTTANLHKLALDVEQEDTLLLVNADASAEATRRLNLRKVPRTVLSFAEGIRLVQLELGAGITVTSPRYGLSAGPAAQVISLEIDWLAGRVKVGAIK